MTGESYSFNQVQKTYSLKAKDSYNQRLSPTSEDKNKIKTKPTSSDFNPFNLMTNDLKLELLSVGSLHLLFDDQGDAQPHLIELLDLLGFNNSHLGQCSYCLAKINQWAQQTLLRHGERWHTQTNHFQHLKEKIFPLLKLIGLVEAIQPCLANYDSCLFFGATLPAVRSRLSYLIKQWNRGVRFKSLIFFGSERPLESGFEGPRQLLYPYLSPITIQQDWSPTYLPSTEHEMMQMVWEQAELPSKMRNQLDVYFINTPMQKIEQNGYITYRRPDTADTIDYWFQHYSPKPGLYLAISDSPHARRQDLVARTVLPSDFLLDTIGEKAPEQKRITDFLDELARWIYQITVYEKKHHHL